MTHGLVPQGGSASFLPDGTEDPGAEHWQITDPSGTVIARKSSPNGWSAAFDGTNLIVSAPANAAIEDGYRVRVHGGGSFAGPGASGGFGVTPQFQTNTGTTTAGEGGPPAPTNLVATGSAGTISLSWSESASNCTYTVYRSTSSTSGFGAIASGVSTKSYTDAPVTAYVVYYYFVTATNSTGTSSGSNEASAEASIWPPAPATPTNLGATPGNHQITLTWTGYGGTYEVFRVTGSSPSYTYTGVASTTSTSTIISGLTNGTTYTYVVNASSEWGSSGYSNQASATPEAPPAAPTGLVATAGVSQVSLAWNTVSGATSYNVFRSTTSGSGYGGIGTVSAANFIDNTVTNGTLYYYVVSATEVDVTGPYSNQASATPLGPIPAPSFTAVGQNASVLLTWNQVSGAQSYNIYRSTTPGGETKIASGLSGTSHTDTGLTNGTTYYYEMTSVNSNGSEGPLSGEVAATPMAGVPLAPTNLQLMAGNNQVTVNWTPSLGAPSYNVLRSTASGSETMLASGVSCPFVDSTALNGLKYYYEVTANDYAGTSAASAEASVTLAPNPPVLLTAQPADSSVALSWAASVGATSYNVWRVPLLGGYSPQQLGTLSTLSYTDQTAVNGTTYLYWITAANSGGQSGQSNTLTATPEPNAPAAPTLSAVASTYGLTPCVNLSWNVVPGATSYNLYRSFTSGGASGSGQESLYQSGLTGTSYPDTAVSNGTTYFYTLVAVNGGGTSAYSNEVSATPGVPAAPINLMAAGGNTTVTLNWTASTGANSYNVYRSLSLTGPFAFRGATNSATTVYGDTGLTNGTTYYYVVTAVGTYGESVFSNVASAVPYLAVPSPPSLYGIAGNKSCYLWWTVPTNATGYLLLRSTDGINYSQLPISNPSQITATHYLDTGLTNGTTYSYEVEAVDATGAGNPSAPISLTPSGVRNPIGILPNPPLGYLPDALTLPEYAESAIPTDESDAPSGGPSSLFSVSLPFGVLDVNITPDIQGDPLGGTMPFALRYRTALAMGDISSPGLPPGWTHNWDYRIVPPQDGNWGNLQLVYPNGASETLAVTLIGGVPTGQIGAPTGAPYTVSGVPSATTGFWTSITILRQGNCQDSFTLGSGDSVYRLTTRQNEDLSQTIVTYSSGCISQLSSQIFDASQQSYQPNTSNIGMYMDYSGGMLSSVNTNNGVSDNYTYNTLTNPYNSSSGGQLWRVSDRTTSAPLWTFGYTSLESEGGDGGVPVINSVTTYGFTATAAIDSVTGRVDSLTDANGAVRAYSNTGNSTSVTVGPSATSTTNSCTVTNDSLGRITSNTDAAGNTTNYSFTSPNIGALTSASVNGGSSGTTIARDLYGNPTQITTSYGNSAVLSWAYSVDPLGQLTQVQEFGNDGSSKQPTTYTYYPANASAPGTFPLKLWTVTKPCGGVTTYKYTALGNVQEIDAPTAVSGVSAVTQYTYTSSNLSNPIVEAPNRPLSMIDPNGNTYLFGYEGSGCGRLVSVTDPAGYNVSANLDGYDNPSSILAPEGTYRFAFPGGDKPPTSATITAPNTNTAYSLFSIAQDSEYSPTSSLDYMSNQMASTISHDAQYGLSSLLNDAGVQMHTYTPNYAANSDTYQIGNPNNNPATWTHQFDVDGYVSNFATPRASGTSSTMFDLLQNYSATVTNSDGSTNTSTNTYGPDPFGRCGSSVNSTCEHDYTYDDEDHILSDSFVDSPVASYTYGPNGARTSMTVNGLTFTYGYDNNGNLTSISGFPGGATYEYDIENRLTAAKTAQINTYYHYDAQGHLDALYNLTPTSGYSAGLMTMPDPLGEGTHGVLSKFWNISYDAYGHRTGFSYAVSKHTPDPDDVNDNYSSGTTSYNYSDYSLGSETWNPSDSSPITISYGYDSAGNLTNARGNSIGVTAASDQISGGSGAWSPYSNITYDLSGNVTGYNSSTLTYDAFEELSSLTQPTEWEDPMEPSGKRSGARGVGAKKLGANKLGATRHAPTTTGSDSVTSKFYYDSNGLRIERDFYLNDETEDLYRDLYTYDGDLLVCLISKDDARPSGHKAEVLSSFGGDFYVYGPSGLIQDSYASFEFDPNGSTIGRVGFDGERIEDPHLYDAYGEPVWPYSGQPGLGLEADYNGEVFLYKGQYGCVTDTDTGLVYCHHRYYDPMACRWISRDPAGLEGGINTYQYCNGDPIDAADPSGTSPISLPILVQNELARERAEQVIAAIGKGTLFVAGGALCLAAADEALDVAALYAAGQEAREIAQGVRAINDIRTVANYYHGDLVRSPLWQTGTRRRHHIFPQQYRILFEEQWGIQIDDYVYEMPGWLHDAIHRGEGQGRGGWWNNQWRGFIELHKGVKPPIPEILKFGSHLMHEIGVPRLDLKP